jgi:acetolactate synthase-1/2/3 large subunit
MKLSDYVVEYLATITDTIFMLSGGGIMHLVDSVGQSKLNAVCCHHEQACGTAAEGYGRIKNTPGVTLVTTGPGGTNVLTGVAGSWLDSIPMLVVSGQVKTDNLVPRVNGVPSVRAIGFQELNVIDMAKPITKLAVSLEDPQDIRYLLEKAVYMATSGRPGPSWVEIPLDLQLADVDPKTLRGFTPPLMHTSEFAKPAIPIELIVSTLIQAKRPLLLVGNGVRLSGAEKELWAFLEQSHINVMTTMYTSDDLVTYEYPYYLGRQGMPGNIEPGFAVDNCDVLLVVGERLQLTQLSYDYANFATQAKKIMVDIDSAELHKKTIQIDIPVCSDAKVFFQQLLKQKIKLKRWKIPVGEIAWKNYPSPSGRLNIYHFLDKLSSLLKTYDHDVATADGMASVASHQALRIQHGQRFLTNAGLGHMGSGLPLAIGAALATHKSVVCMEGDGSLMLNMQEIQTAIHHNLPIKLFIWNNGGYYSIRQTHKNYFERVFASDNDSGVSLPDYSKLMPAWGLPYVAIERDRDLKKLESVMKHKGPIACELIIDQDQPMLPKWVAGMYRNQPLP